MTGKRELTPEQKERYRATRKAWRDANKEHLAAYQREYDKRPERKSRPNGYYRAKPNETPEEQARRLELGRAAEARYMEKLRADPERLAHYRERRAREQKQKMARIKADPDRYADYMRRQRAYQKRYMAQLKQDPVKYAAYLERNRGYLRKQAQRARMLRQVEPKPGEIFKGRLYQNELYLAVAKVVERQRPSDARDDLIAEAVLLMLEGETDAAQAVKLARRQLTKDSFKTVSMDAVNQYGKTLHDYITAEEAA